MTQGIIVARDGYAVETATVLQQVFNSGLNTLKVLSTGTLTSTASGNRVVQYDPSVDYQCAFIAWFEVSDNGRWYKTGVSEDFSGGNVYVDCYIDTDGVFNASITSDNSKTVIVKYVLLVDPGS
jgi:hypothetical protein